MGCWMGWPYDPCLWRDGAVPAKKTYAAVATTISQFEPVTMLADPAVRSLLLLDRCCYIVQHALAVSAPTGRE